MDQERTADGTWYCRIQKDLSDMDTVPLKLLPIRAIEKPAAAAVQPAGGDPYNCDQPVPAAPPESTRRRTLDDMRKLSEEIKRMRSRVSIAHP